MGVDPAALRRCHVAVDLGASRTRIHVRHDGLVVDEPSLAAVDTRTGGLVAVGTVAARMLGRAPEHIRVARPISGGTVVDTELARSMLRHMVGHRVISRWRRPGRVRAVVGVPHDAGPLTRKAAIDGLTGLGVRRVELVDAPVAAAVGCGLPVDRPEAAMVVVCGATTTQIAVLSLREVIAATVVPVGGDAVDHAIAEYLRGRHGMVLPTGGVRDICSRLDTADAVISVTGKDLGSGMARTLGIECAGVREVIATQLASVLDGISGVLRRSPADLVVDLADRAITLAGGGALIPGIDAMVRTATGMPTQVAPQPQTRIINGLAHLIGSRFADLPSEPPLRESAPTESPTDTPTEETPATEAEDFAPVA